jgi:Zn-finger nucleic acid-binding protein
MSEEEALPCRGCDGSLEEVEVDGRQLWMCRSCGGALAEQRDLVPILTAAAREIADSISFDHEIEPLEPPKAPLCPDCDGPMQAFGYMGTHLVHPARCPKCAVVWMGPEVMGAMTVLFARTNLRQDAQIAQMQADIEERERRTTAVVINRVRERWMM